MKAIQTLLLLALPLLFSGCMTRYCLTHANGTAGEKVYINDYTDKIIRNDGTNCVIQRISSKGATNELHLHLVTSDSGYVRKPAYYALVPLTLPPDILSFPWQVVFGLFPLFPPIG